MKQNVLQSSDWDTESRSDRVAMDSTAGRDPDEHPPDEHPVERDRLAADWERARTAVFAQLLAGIGSFHDAEDVLQEVAVSVARNYGQYDRQRPFVAWALGIARNHMLMYFRKHHRDRLVFSEELMLALSPHLQSQAERWPDYRREALHRCISQLDERRRRLVELRYSSGLSVAEIAERLGKSASAVKGALHRVRAALETCIRHHTNKSMQ